MSYETRRCKLGLNRALSLCGSEDSSEAHRVLMDARLSSRLLIPLFVDSGAKGRASKREMATSSRSGRASRQLEALGDKLTWLLVAP